MSANQPTSFRYPFNLKGKIHEEADAAIRYAFSGLKDLNDAIRSLNTKVNTNTKAITAAAAVAGGAGTTVVNNLISIFHDEPLTDGQGNFIFAGGDIVVVTGVVV